MKRACVAVFTNEYENNFIFMLTDVFASSFHASFIQLLKNI
ncbi:MAG TPA: hypothetical protein PLD12_05840 [Bacteroidales bacterium]|nr:hypothetical protein [Bacteroidales bacterium]HPO65555.1 hypothetical protein [Bacteroidales bacterium]